jgi:hypothetical protein
MDDLVQRLRQVERNPSPDLWDEIVQRTPVDAEPPRRLPHRLAAGLVAAFVAIAAFAFLVVAFQPNPPATPSVPTPAPLRIRAWTTSDPFDVHFSATYLGERVDLEAIETPGPDLEYPEGLEATLPVGTPIVVEPGDALAVSIFELAPARGQFVAGEGSCIVPGALARLPGPAETAFLVFAQGDGFAGGQAFRASTVGDALDREAALDRGSAVDARTLGLAVCSPTPEPDEPATAGKQTFAEGSDPLAGSWRLFTQQNESGPVWGIILPGAGQTFTHELPLLNDRTLATWLISGTRQNDALVIAAVVAPTVASAEVRLDDGRVFDADVVDLPEEIIGPARVVVAGFPSQMSAEGQHIDPNGYLVAYGADGDELVRHRLGEN